MTNRQSVPAQTGKQEAIKVIANEFWGTQAINYSPEYYAEKLYNRIAPLARGEFPEEEIRSHIRDEMIGHGEVKP